jgi:hypothetical protein
VLMIASSGHHLLLKTLIYIVIMDVLREVSYQISPKFRTKLANITEVFSTLSTKCPAQHAQLIHISRVKPAFAQRTKQLTTIMFVAVNESFVVKSCHLAHRFSQTCIPSLSGLCGGVGGGGLGGHQA